jgi:hypothetical protein
MRKKLVKLTETQLKEYVISLVNEEKHNIMMGSGGIDEIDINPEADEISLEDLDASSDMFDRISSEDDTEFTPHGSYTVSNTGGFEIMLSDDGDMAKVRDAFGSDNPKTSDWLEIEYIDDEETGELEPVIDPLGYNIPLNKVMRMNEESFMKMRAGVDGKVFENNVSNQDPTKEEMLNVLSSEMSGFEGTDNFSAEEAIYWYAYDHHGGQNSNLYSVLSTTEYKPSPLLGSIEDITDEMTLTMYNTLVSNFGGEEVSLGGESDYEEDEDIKLNEAITRFKNIINY